MALSPERCPLGQYQDGERPLSCGLQGAPKAEWQEAHDNNTWTWTGDGYAIDIGDGGSPEFYLPAAGFRTYDSGLLIQVGFVGSYWASTNFGTLSTGSHFIYLDSSGVSFSLDRRSNGYSVRCMAE